MLFMEIGMCLEVWKLWMGGFVGWWKNGEFYLVCGMVLLVYGMGGWIEGFIVVFNDVMELYW